MKCKTKTAVKFFFTVILIAAVIVLLAGGLAKLAIINPVAGIVAFVLFVAIALGLIAYFYASTVCGD